jgi:hypothetical protein
VLCELAVHREGLAVVLVGFGRGAGVVGCVGRDDDVAGPAVVIVVEGLGPVL